MARFDFFLRGLTRSRCWIRAMVMLLACTQAYAQTAAQCPPPPTAPTKESMQALMRDARDRGFLWMIEKDGKIGHIHGSIHVGKPAWSIPGPKTMAAIATSGVVALELDILDAAVQSQLTDAGRFGIKSFDLPPKLRDRMAAAARRVCAPLDQFAGQHPVMQLVTISLFDARFAELEVAFGSEVFLSSFAKGSKMTVESLETVESQLRALLEGPGMASVAAVERGLTQFENGRSRAVLSRLAEAWATGNLAELQDYQKWCECAETDAERKALQALNDERNPHLAASIDKLMRGGKKVFAAVGALHMTGPKALPLLLQQMGYRLERVSF